VGFSKKVKKKKKEKGKTTEKTYIRKLQRNGKKIAIFEEEQSNPQRKNEIFSHELCKDINQLESSGELTINDDEDKIKIEFNVNSGIKNKRIRQILQAIKNGLIAHSSGEDNTIVPLFLIAAPVKIPTPIFHSYIDVSIENGKIKVIGLKDCVENSWLCDKVYIKDTERISVDTSGIKDRLYSSWEEFLRACGLEDKNEEKRCPSSE